MYLPVDLHQMVTAGTPKLSPEQLKMQQVLKEKSVMVVTKLVDMLSPKNADELHMTLNAQNVLNEFCDNESFF